MAIDGRGIHTLEYKEIIPRGYAWGTASIIKSDEDLVPMESVRGP